MNIIYENKSEPIILMESKSLSSLPHMHKEIEIIYVKDGFAKAHADRECVDINSGDIFISFPNQVHFYEKSKKGSYYVIIISHKVFFGMKDMLYSNLPSKNVVKANEDTQQLFENFVKSKKLDDTSSCVGYLNLIFADIISRLPLRAAVRSSDGSLREIMNFCETHFSEDISLSTVSQNTHLSRCYISHLFASKLNLSFTDYINMLRINAACELILETDKKIADISGEVGFGTIRSFNRAFSKIMETTPQNYRSRIS